MTGLQNFGVYMNKLLTIDAFFLNEDRHMHNIAVLMNGKGDYAYCPIFDNGAGLLADTTMDYPLAGDIYTLMEKVQAQNYSPHDSITHKYSDLRESSHKYHNETFSISSILQSLWPTILTALTTSDIRVHFYTH